MKYPVFILLATLLSGCSSLMVLQEGNGADASPSASLTRGKAGTTLPLNGTDYPSVAVTPEGGHAVVMPPCGNTSVVVNPDGSHSIAVINGTTATIVTP